MALPPHHIRAADREEWRRWLTENHGREKEIWLLFAKKGTGLASVTYDEAVEEALCFGWIDGLLKRIDETHYMQRFTPRKPKSNWSESNRKRFEKMVAAGRMTEAGMATPPEKASRYIPSYQRSDNAPAYLRRALQEQEPAWTRFQQLAPSHRKKFIAWIDSAKREETRGKRIAEAVKMLLEKKVLGINAPAVTKRNSGKR